MALMILTYRYRIKDATSGKRLAALARAVNRVWNYCGEIQETSRRHNKSWPSAFDLIKLTTGSSTLLGLHSDTVNAVCRQFAVSRDAAKRRPRWRGKKSLGWIPFAAARAIKIDGDTVIYLKRHYRFWNSRAVDGKIKCGSFAQDARGRWYLNVQLEVVEKQDCGASEVGIDLGLRSLATLSDGRKIENPKQFQKYEAALATAQRARNKKRAQAIHAKIANARKDFLHKQSMALVQANKLIVVGNVKATTLPYRTQRKSALDASWSAFRAMLRYKAIGHGATYIEADEQLSSASCSACGARSGPEGTKALRIREWACDGCGARHDRDINAAVNLLSRARTLASVAARPQLPGICRALGSDSSFGQQGLCEMWPTIASPKFDTPIRLCVNSEQEAAPIERGASPSVGSPYADERHVDGVVGQQFILACPFTIGHGHVPSRTNVICWGLNQTIRFCSIARTGLA
jgi:IS605 OrfB family transposase